MSVYKIYNADKCYIGSTEQKIEKRLNFHRNKKNNTCTSKLIVCEPDWDWVVLENNIPLDQLVFRERYWYDITENKVNKMRPVISREERLEHDREYKRQHSFDNNAKKREYYQNNKEAITAKYREYREKNKDAINAKQREYRQKKKLAKQCVTSF